jgi:hypothetical protein
MYGLKSLAAQTLGEGEHNGRHYGLYFCHRGAPGRLSGVRSDELRLSGAHPHLAWVFSISSDAAPDWPLMRSANEILLSGFQNRTSGTITRLRAGRLNVRRRRPRSCRRGSTTVDSDSGMALWSWTFRTPAVIRYLVTGVLNVVITRIVTGKIYSD